MENKSVAIQSTVLTYNFPQAGKKISHLAIGAHPDDVEIFAFNAIHQCYQNNDKHFAAIICSNGSGAPAYGEFKEKSKDEIVKIRKEEQEKAAQIGNYSGLIHFNLESEVLKKGDEVFVNDLKALIEFFKPDYIYTHSPFDDHKTHRCTLRACLQALQMINDKSWLKGFYACEVWGSLDWLPRQYKYVLGENEGDDLQMQLLDCFYSQNIGSQKRYDLGTIGRKLGNATFFESDKGNLYTHQSYALDLSSVINQNNFDISKYCVSIVADYLESIKNKLVDLQ
ncbi:MAG TPA: PIG-L family deacetylase [Oligoflexia bacterium]|nr:PIG-L family deacetylase [Oligoflexia bacterium]HMR23799.1 PIG-L family deacetylase [Oligoflexia bacterium]